MARAYPKETILAYAELAEEVSRAFQRLAALLILVVRVHSSTYTYW